MELFEYSLIDLLDLIRHKNASSQEICQGFINRAKTVNPKINAIFQIDEARILKEAQIVDNKIAQGKAVGAMMGLPFTVKDSLITKDIITTGGLTSHLHTIPNADTSLVARLKAQDGIVLGKTNVPDLCYSWETDSTAYGLTRNPYNLNHHAGGSSGGEAAIIASMGSPIGIGSDGGGSIRIPANYCGLAGYRPSNKLLPTSGHTPPFELAFVSTIFANFVCLGLLSRSFADIQYTLPYLIGPDGVDPNTQAFALPQSNKSIKELKVAYYATDGKNHPSAEIQQAIKEVAKLLQNAGATVIEIEPNKLLQTAAHDIYGKIVAFDGGEGANSFLEKNNKPLPQTIQHAKMMLPHAKMDIMDFMGLWSTLDHFRLHMQNDFKDYDLILSPISMQTALPVTEFLSDPQHQGGWNYAMLSTLIGWPAVNIPVGLSQAGLPIGVQLIGKYWQDKLLLDITSQLEKMIGYKAKPNI